MLKTLWQSLLAPKVAESVRASFDRAKLKMLAEHFPIGKKVRYYPEFHRNIVFHTIIIAYRVNDQFLYSRDAVVADSDGVPTGFRLDGNKVLPVEKLAKFQLLVPDTTEMERTLDYFTRAEIGRAGQFRQGNTITLVAEIAARGIPTVDTEVDRRQIMNSGPYEANSMVLITPDFGSLVLADQRRKQRVQTDIVADLYLETDAHFRCVLGDFSESSLRLRTIDSGYTMPATEAGDKVIIVFSFGDVATSYRIKGQVFRPGTDSCVIQMEELYKDGEFAKIKMMDIMEIKTGLLNLFS